MALVANVQVDTLPPNTGTQLAPRHVFVRPHARRKPAAPRGTRPTSSLRKAMAPRSSGALETQQQRWEASVRGGRVKNITPPEAAALMKEGWIVVDVRPPNETEIARIRGAVEVPLFVVDDEASFGNFIKQAMAFGMGGWWLGGAHMRPNGKFLSQVESQAPKDAKIIVVCQKGLRSLAASEQLARAGYTTIAWVNGGLDTARPGEVPTVGGVDVRFAGIGGLSALIGWTEVQQETSGQNLAGFPFWAILGVLGLASAYQVMDLLSLDFSKVGGQW